MTALRDNSTTVHPIVVWVPESGGHAGAIEEATHRLGLKGHTSIWDGKRAVMRFMADLVGTEVPLWDAYFAYPAGKSRPGTLPPPKVWAHQLWALQKTHGNLQLEPNSFVTGFDK